MVVMAVVLIGAVLAAGVFFFWLHSLPERMVHNKVQFDVVAVLALLSLFTHIHAFWVAALLLALVRIPDFSFPNLSKPLGSIAGSLQTMAAQPAAVEPNPAQTENSDKTRLSVASKPA
jgi:hypothetical protein